MRSQAPVSLIALLFLVGIPTNSIASELTKAAEAGDAAKVRELLDKGQLTTT